METFYKYCADIANETDVGRIQMMTREALRMLCDIFTDIYIVSYDAAIPVMLERDGMNYAECFLDEESADCAAAKDKDAMVVLMPDNKNRLEILYRNGFDALVVHVTDTKRAVLILDKVECFNTFTANGKTCRPELSAIIYKLDRALDTGNTEVANDMAGKMYREVGNGNLYVIRNKVTGEILYDEDSQTHEPVVLTYTDVNAMYGTSGVEFAIKKYGRENCEEFSAGIEQFALPARALMLNDKYFVGADYVAASMLSTAGAKRALNYIEMENAKNNISIDGEELLTRLLNHPDMYREFVGGIDANLKFVGKITARTADYSGGVLLETVANGNAAAAYSLIEKLISHPEIYQHDFETGKITY